MPKVANANDKLKLWLALFKATTEEELENLVSIGGEDMAQAVEAYHSVSATEEFRMLERMRQDMRNNEVTALNHARREGIKQGMQIIARNMIDMGIDADTIAKATGLFIDDVLRLHGE